jgi:hypothetical protein
MVARPLINGHKFMLQQRIALKGKLPAPPFGLAAKVRAGETWEVTKS